MGFQTGNAPADSARFDHWFIGELRTWALEAGLEPPADGFGLRDTSQVEVKWAHHPAGQARPGGWAGPSEHTSLSLLVHGRFELRFRPPDVPAGEQICILEKGGDYALWDGATAHTWRALEDSVVLTIRWRAES